MKRKLKLQEIVYSTTKYNLSRFYVRFTHFTKILLIHIIVLIAVIFNMKKYWKKIEHEFHVHGNMTQPSSFIHTYSDKPQSLSLELEWFHVWFSTCLKAQHPGDSRRQVDCPKSDLEKECIFSNQEYSIYILNKSKKIETGYTMNNFWEFAEVRAQFESVFDQVCDHV